MQAATQTMSNQNGQTQTSKLIKMLEAGKQDSKRPTGRSKKSPASVSGYPSGKNNEKGGTITSITGMYGYNERDDDNSDHDEEEEPMFMTALRRGSLSRSESEVKLAQQLSQVKDYDLDGKRGAKIQELKERFGTTRNMVSKMERRGSTSSFTSQGSASIISQSSVSYAGSGDGSIDIMSIMNSSKKSEASLSGGSNLLKPHQASVRSLGTNASTHTGVSFNMSSNTLPVANVVKKADTRKTSIKTDQIIESLVWFSFHTPRTVLEDLISHEMELWRLERAKSATNLITGMDKITKLSQHSASSGSNSSSVSAMSDEGGKAGANFSEVMIQMRGRTNRNNMIELPKCVERESALLFVDMSGFTKLSTMLDVESLSKVINSYFDMIVSEVIYHGGDILKFAGDAFFAEWKVISDSNDREGDKNNPLANLNASLASISEMAWDDDEIPTISNCVLSAAKCGASIVRKFSDYNATAVSSDGSQAMLNVHCGVGVGHLVGLHVGDFKEDQEEEGVELRREFLILGEPIDQVCVALPFL